MGQPSIDRVTIVGLGLLLLPLLTMWLEIGGHAATCAALGGHVAVIGAFYVDCHGLGGLADRVVACAGIAMDGLLSLIAWQAWLRIRAGDLLRLCLFYVWIIKGFVAAGYFLFSGVTAFGDLGTDAGNGMAGLAHPLLWRLIFVAVGGLVYWRLCLAAVGGLDTMLGRGPETRVARRRIAHLFYGVIGVDAVVVGLFNPVGIVITIMSAAASSFGGNGGLISVGYAVSADGEPRGFTIGRHWTLLAAGVLISLIFGLVLGPSVHPDAG